MTNIIGSDSVTAVDVSEVQAKIELLKTKIEGAIRKVRDDRKDNRKKATYVKLSVILLSGIATVLLGLQLPNLTLPFKNIAFVLTALVTVLNALEPFFNFRALWVEHEIALWKFYRLKDKTELYLAGNRIENISIEKVNSFQVEYESIWNDLSQSWINYRKQEKS